MKAIIAGGCGAAPAGSVDSILVFPQHRAFLDRRPPHLWVGDLRATQPERKIAVEADSTDLALQLAHAGVDTLQLDKLPPEDVGAIAQALAGMARRRLLVTTGVNAVNAEAYARAGADLVVTSAPYAAAPADIAVALTPFRDPL